MGAGGCGTNPPGRAHAQRGRFCYQHGFLSLCDLTIKKTHENQTAITQYYKLKEIYMYAYAKQGILAR